MRQRKPPHHIQHDAIALASAPGKHWAGGPALHAAALEPDLFASLTLDQCLASWVEVVRTPLARYQYVNVVHGALRTYDLPDLVAALPPDKVKIKEPLDAKEQPRRSDRLAGR